MSFWNNPENNSIKILLIAIVVIGAGAFVYHAMNIGGDTGRVINTVNTTTPRPASDTCTDHTYPEPNADGGCRTWHVHADCTETSVQGGSECGKALNNTSTGTVKVPTTKQP